MREAYDTHEAYIRHTWQTYDVHRIQHMESAGRCTYQNLQYVVGGGDESVDAPTVGRVYSIDVIGTLKERHFPKVVYVVAGN